MNSLLLRALKASRDTDGCLDTIDILRGMNFTDDAFQKLHHQGGSLDEFYSYSEGVKRFQDGGNNHRVHQRLVYDLLSCSGGSLPKGKSFLTLAEEAFRLIPPVA